MKIETSELIGPALDWAVAKCEGYGSDVYMRSIDLRFNARGKVSCMFVPVDRTYVQWSPSTNWAQGGPIIARERIELYRAPLGETEAWLGDEDEDSNYNYWGPTTLIAAMRAFVASRLGD